ncbi:hypothetical protein [Rhizobium sp. Leaf386]|uniref:hypothetical protein n=1 Tax=Rhizobium sp. Leaf386 TaxID=1736359 RepID=UPI0012E0E78B|nr:hypothetical protein [Rhizobium sp. Leaf386]
MSEIIPLKPKERNFLRQLNDRDGEFLMARGLAEKLAGAALVQAGYATRHSVLPHHFSINPAGEYYLGRLMRPH